MKTCNTLRKKNEEALCLGFLSNLFGLTVTIVLLFGKSVLPTSSSMISCTSEMVLITQSSMVYKIEVLLVTLGLPIGFIFLSNLIILSHVSYSTRSKQFLQ